MYQILRTLRYFFYSIEFIGFVVLAVGMTLPSQPVLGTVIISLLTAFCFWAMKFRMWGYIIFPQDRWQPAPRLFFVPIIVFLLIIGAILADQLAVKDFARCLTILIGLGIILIPGAIESF